MKLIIILILRLLIVIVNCLLNYASCSMRKYLISLRVENFINSLVSCRTVVK